MDKERAIELQAKREEEKRYWSNEDNFITETLKFMESKKWDMLKMPHLSAFELCDRHDIVSAIRLYHGGPGKAKRLLELE